MQIYVRRDEEQGYGLEFNDEGCVTAAEGAADEAVCDSDSERAPRAHGATYNISRAGEPRRTALFFYIYFRVRVIRWSWRQPVDPLLFCGSAIAPGQSR